MSEIPRVETEPNHPPHTPPRAEGGNGRELTEQERSGLWTLLILAGFGVLWYFLGLGFACIGVMAFSLYHLWNDAASRRARLARRPPAGGNGMSGLGTG